ncbi:hypothetical protein V496_09700, partial [Pseudogymnoascus sp. VKM F-4515 (FW-2607)]
MYSRRNYALALLAGVPVGYWEKEGSHIADITDAVTPRQAPAHPVDISGCILHNSIVLRPLLLLVPSLCASCLLLSLPAKERQQGPPTREGARRALPTLLPKYKQSLILIPAQKM